MHIGPRNQLNKTKIANGYLFNNKTKIVEIWMKILLDFLGSR